MKTSSGPTRRPWSPIPAEPLTAAEQRQYENVCEVYEQRSSADEHPSFCAELMACGQVRNMMVFNQQANATRFSLSATSMLMAAHAMRNEPDRLNSLIEETRVRGHDVARCCYAAGKTLMQSGENNLNFAERMFLRGLREAPKDANLAAALGMTRRVRGDMSGGAKWFLAAQKGEGEVDVPLVGIGAKVLVAAGRLSEANAWIQKSLATHGPNPRMLASLAALFVTLPNPETVEDTLRLVIESEVPKEALDELIFATVYGGFSDLIVPVKNIVMQFSAECTAHNDLLGTGLLRIHEEEDATILFLRAAERDQVDSLYFVHRGLLLEKAHVTGALAVLEKGLERYPKDSDLCGTMGEFLLKHGSEKDKRRAINLLEQSLQHQPHTRRLILLAETLSFLPDCQDRADEMMWRAATHATEGALPIYASLAGRLLKRGKRGDRAEKALRYIVARDPENPKAKKMLADLLAGKGMSEEGAALLKEVYRTQADIDVQTAGLRRAVVQTCLLHTQRRAPLPYSVRSKVNGTHVQGIVEGRAYDNRIVLRQADGTRVWLPFEAQALDTGVFIKPSESVAESSLYFLSDEFQATLDAWLMLPRFGDKSILDVCNALTRNELEENFVTGGALARLLGGDALDHEVDGDVVTTLLPMMVEYACGAVAGNPTSADLTRYLGVVSFGGEKGVDVATIRQHGMYEARTSVLGSGDSVFPLAFGTDLLLDAEARDFTANALYYSPLHRCLLDPTGHGVADALAKRLRLPSDKYLLLNDSYYLRFFKMIKRGFTADAYILRQIGRSAEHALATSTPQRIIHNLVKAIPVDIQNDAEPAVALQVWLADMLQVMHNSGLGETVERYIRPLVPRLVEALEKAGAEPDLSGDLERLL